MRALGKLYLLVLCFAAEIVAVFTIIEGIGVLDQAEAITHQLYAVGWFVVAGVAALVALAAAAFYRWVSMGTR